jgi:hypothetical protein
VVVHALRLLEALDALTDDLLLGKLTLWFLPGEFDQALPRVRQLAYNR